MKTFQKDIKALMYGFGDVRNPIQESVDVVDELLELFIVDLCEKAVKYSTSTKVKTSDFLKALEGDVKKEARAHELLNLDKELKAARATFGESVSLEITSKYVE
jgi:transcription initiation factor TFIID subunit 13